MKNRRTPTSLLINNGINQSTTATNFQEVRKNIEDAQKQYDKRAKRLRLATEGKKPYIKPVKVKREKVNKYAEYSKKNVNKQKDNVLLKTNNNNDRKTI